MKWSLYIGEFKEIKIFIHWTFILLLFWIGFSSYQLAHNTDQVILSVGYIMSLFLCVVLHEFGHALTARRFNIKTRDITLFPIEGMARMEKLPDSPKEEFLVALAGPMVNIVIALILFLYMHFSSRMYEVSFPSGLMTAEKFLPMLFAVNILMALFNLIPAFPMDGGRIFRAALSLKYDRPRATAIAAKLGQFLAIGFIGFGIFYNIWLVFIGIFIYLGAGAEASHEYVRSDLSHITVRNLLMTKFSILQSKDLLAKALRLLLDSQEKEFLVADQDRIVGILTRDEMIVGLSQFGAEVSIGTVMRSDIIFLPPEMPVDQALQLLTENNLPMLPVGTPDSVLGIIDTENISEFLMIQKASH